MENRVDDFVTGVKITFGKLARSPEELDAFLRAAEAFYLDFIGAHTRSITPQTARELPFWRYLIFYSTLALDHAASTLSEDQDDDTSRNLASEISSYWPFLAALVTAQYSVEPLHVSSPWPHDPSPMRPKLSRGLPTSGSTDLHPNHDHAPVKSAATQTEDQHTISLIVSSSYSDARSSASSYPVLTGQYADQVATPASDYSYPHAPPHHVAPVGGDFAYRSSPTTETSLSLDSFSTHSGGRSLSSSTNLTDTSTSTMVSSDMPQTPPQTLIGDGEVSTEFTDQPHHLQDKQLSHPHVIQKDALAHVRVPCVRSVSFAPSRPHAPTMAKRSLSSGSCTPTGTRTTNSHEMEYRAPKTLLADRGDNTAKLVPTGTGSFVLDVSIGGRKLVIHPDKPGELQYHDRQGTVVTQYLVPAAVRSQ